MTKLNVLILEDEDQAAIKLKKMIATLPYEIEISHFQSISEALEFFNSKPNLDLLFSDIELLDGNVFTLYSQINPDCPIIFCTAYNDFFLEAFETNGIAYLLKPYSKRQFMAAWDKYVHLFQPEKPAFDNRQLLAAIADISNRMEPSYKKHFVLKKKNESFIVEASNILYFEADGDYVIAWDQQMNKNLLSQTLTETEHSLDPAMFFRINRSQLVNFNAIAGFEPYIKTRLAIILKKHDQKLLTSNSRSAAFKQWIEQH